MTISSKITFSFLILVLILTGGSTYISYIVNRNTIIERINHHLVEIVQSRANHIKTFLEEDKSRAKIIAASVEIKSSLKEIIRNKQESDKLIAKINMSLKNYFQAEEEAYEIFIMSPDGKVIASNDERHIGYDTSKKDYFLGAFEDTYIKDVYFSQTTGERGYVVSTAVRDNNTKEILGVLAMRFKIIGLNKITTDRTGLGRTGEIYLVNKSGFMVTPSRFVKESFLKQKVDTINTKKAFDDYQKLSTSPGEIEEHEEEVLIYDDYRGIPVLGTHSYVPEMQWFVISEIDKKEAFESLDIIRNFYIIVLIAILIIVFLIGTYIARRISKPIEKLQEGVKIIGDGNLDYKVGTDTQDEIGHLSKMFDRMTENLKQTTASRDDLNREIAERKKAEEKLKENEKKLHSLSITDELTGLYNRRGFFTLAEQQLKQSIRDKKGIYLVLADVDHLKRINDNLGHHEGDVVLIKTANLLKESFRESDIIARIGGDEFVILVNETPETTIDTITVRLKENIKAYNNTKSKNYEISLSIGVIHCSSEEPCNLEELIIKADKLMYTEKKQKF